MSILEHLSQVVGQAFAAVGLDAAFGRVEVSRRSDLAHFQCNGAMAAARRARRAPREIAQEVAERLAGRPELAEVQVAGPGFINIKLTDEELARRADEALADERVGCDVVADPQKVVLDFGGPNVAKAMHVGHLRSSIVGDCLQRLLRFAGDEVVSDIHMGDWGLPIGMLICELQDRRPELPYFDPEAGEPWPSEPPVSVDDLAELYPVAATRCKQDEAARQRARQVTAELQAGRPGYRALWRQFMEVSLEAIKRDFRALGVDFDLWLGESAVAERLESMVERLRAAGHVVASEGAEVIHLDDGGREIPPLIVVKADGGVTYGATDLATIEDRVEKLSPSQILYVVDKRQELHFEQVFRAARKTGIASEVGLEHIKFGTVNGPDGRPFKTREGGVMRLSELIASATEQARRRLDEGEMARDLDPAEREEVARKVGLAALKFADLSNDRESNYIFDLEKFTRFEGRTGPYLLYAAVRIKSIFRKAAERGVEAGPVVAAGLGESERSLVLRLFMLPEVIRRARADRAPNALCEFAYDLAQEFSRFYNNCPILPEPDPALRAARLSLARLTLRQLELLLDLVGIEMPERM